MHLLYPSDPLDESKPDESYVKEFKAMEQAGHHCFLYSSTEFELQRF